MTRGNQRELAREKNLKKLQDAKKKAGDKDGMSLEQRKQRDADLMRQKQMKKAEGAGPSSSTS